MGPQQPAEADLTVTNDPSEHPLRARLTQAQQRVIQVIGGVWVSSDGRWPLYGYVERELEKSGISLEEVLPTFPLIRASGYGALGLNYNALWFDSLGPRPDKEIGLTVAGISHVGPEQQTVVDLFIDSIREMARRRAQATLDPFTPSDDVITSESLSQILARFSDDWITWLPSVFAHEPSIWGGNVGGPQEPPNWTWRLSPVLRHFSGVRDLDDYLWRMTAFLAPRVEEPPSAIEEPPLGFAATLDFLNTVWILKYKEPLIRLPSAAGITSIAASAASAADFDARLSALSEVLKGISVSKIPGVKPHPVQYLGAKLLQELPIESHRRVRDAIDVLESSVMVRNAMQHAHAAPEAVAHLRTFGMTYPVTDWEAAWHRIRNAATSALWAIREELQSSMS